VILQSKAKQDHPAKTTRWDNFPKVFGTTSCGGYIESFGANSRVFSEVGLPEGRVLANIRTVIVTRRRRMDYREKTYHQELGHRKGKLPRDFRT
jgi:hypothetical protein